MTKRKEKDTSVSGSKKITSSREAKFSGRGIFVLKVTKVQPDCWSARSKQGHAALGRTDLEAIGEFVKVFSSLVRIKIVRGPDWHPEKDKKLSLPAVINEQTDSIPQNSEEKIQESVAKIISKRYGRAGLYVAFRKTRPAIRPQINP